MHAGTFPDTVPAWEVIEGKYAVLHHCIRTWNRQNLPAGVKALGDRPQHVGASGTEGRETW
jgi:hypothetical protein